MRRITEAILKPLLVLRWVLFRRKFIAKGGRVTGPWPTSLIRQYIICWRRWDEE